MCVWGSIEMGICARERTFNVSRLLFEVLGSWRFVQFVLGLVWGCRVCLDIEIQRTVSAIVWQIFVLGQVELFDKATYLNTKDMRETATTSMSSRLNPLRQKAFLCRMNP